MPPLPSTAAVHPTLRQARRAWSTLLTDAARAFVAANRALDRALQEADPRAEAWARMTRGLHLHYYGTLAESETELRQAASLFATLADRAGEILATAGLARTLWRGGHFRQAVDLVLPVRDEGLRVLRHHDRAVLLNAIGGCYSALGQSEQAMAYMHEALRDAGPRRGHGFDAVLHCNLANELTQLGDCEQALRHANQGLVRCEGMRNPYLRSALLINRIIILTDLGRPEETLADIAAVLAMPTDASGRGHNALHFEPLAIAALSAGEHALGAELVQCMLAGPAPLLPDERIERAVALAMLAWMQGRLAQAHAHLATVQAQADDDGVEGQSLRVRCQYFQQASSLHAERGDAAAALADLRRWQVLHQRQDAQAHRAHYRSAALQTELLRLTHRLQDSQAKRRITERSRAKLAEINEQLAHRIAEVQSLQEALRQQAVIDTLTGLHNRRHLNEVLPAMVAMAQRSRTPLAVVLIDLDHFKAVNDRLGHPVGDQLLAAFGRLLAGNLRKSDLACRYGGEEFCLLMPRSGAAAARRKVQALLRRWRACTLDGGLQFNPPLSFSAGVADTHTTPAETAALLRAADQALLNAKQAGRGRVLLADAQADADTDAAAAGGLATCSTAGTPSCA
ncbi:GGDEF domain-containing protein [Aquabacterium sp. OR-4]|uniref:GGDEF domain-containing protein n=1 Tax=Aquabacterium sp. OR-4 TaxID=2978127 RepID=UPI0021B33AEC|nr:GGDEF domain-containing protein [Aquabacterium sp. OR-4]MDT7835558.1 GGDEF domain-containing protein [Aquabacterium sp. OR-4]